MMAETITWFVFSSVIVFLINRLLGFCRQQTKQRWENQRRALVAGADHRIYQGINWPNCLAKTSFTRPQFHSIGLSDDRSTNSAAITFRPIQVGKYLFLDESLFCQLSRYLSLYLTLSTSPCVRPSCFLPVSFSLSISVSLSVCVCPSFIVLCVRLSRSVRLFLCLPLSTYVCVHPSAAHVCLSLRKSVSVHLYICVRLSVSVCLSLSGCSAVKIVIARRT